MFPLWLWRILSWWSRADGGLCLAFKSFVLSGCPKEEPAWGDLRLERRSSSNRWLPFDPPPVWLCQMHARLARTNCCAARGQLCQCNEYSNIYLPCMHACTVRRACLLRLEDGSNCQLKGKCMRYSLALQQWLRVRVHVDDSRRGYRLRLQPWMHKHRSQMHIRPDGSHWWKQSKAKQHGRWCVPTLFGHYVAWRIWTATKRNRSPDLTSPWMINPWRCSTKRLLQYSPPTGS